jgi:hypothetical protein
MRDYAKKMIRTPIMFSREHMLCDIHETWGAEYCPCCIKYNDQCNNCFLDKTEICSYLYDNVISSHTWREFGNAANEIIKELQKVIL